MNMLQHFHVIPSTQKIVCRCRISQQLDNIFRMIILFNVMSSCAIVCTLGFLVTISSVSTELVKFGMALFTCVVQVLLISIFGDMFTESVCVCVIHTMSVLLCALINLEFTPAECWRCGGRLGMRLVQRVDALQARHSAADTARTTAAVLDSVQVHRCVDGHVFECM